LLMRAGRNERGRVLIQRPNLPAEPTLIVLVIEQIPELFKELFYHRSLANVRRDGYPYVAGSSRFNA